MAEVDINNAEITTATKGDKNMFQKVKARFSGRKKNKKIHSTADDKNSLENISLSDKELQESEEKKLIDSSDETEKKTKTIEKVKDFLKSSGQNGTLKAENNEEKKKINTLQRVKERFSYRNGRKSKLSNDTLEAEEAEETNMNAEEKNDLEEQETLVFSLEDDVKNKKSTTLQRVKERLSFRKNKNSTAKLASSSDIDNKELKTDNNEEEATPEIETKKETAIEVKRETFIQRLLKLFRKRKANTVENTDILDKPQQDLSEEDREVLEICGNDIDSEEKCSAVPKITTTKPPLPGKEAFAKTACKMTCIPVMIVGRRLPSSATTAHTRPISQLDDALKQFKLSTAASRENLRNSRQDLNQMEEQVWPPML